MTQPRYSAILTLQVVAIYKLQCKLYILNMEFLLVEEQTMPLFVT